MVIMRCDGRRRHLTGSSGGTIDRPTDRQSVRPSVVVSISLDIPSRLLFTYISTSLTWYFSFRLRFYSVDRSQYFIAFYLVGR